MIGRVLSLTLALALSGMLSVPSVTAQQITDRVRVTSIHLEGDSLAFGEVGNLEIALHVAPKTALFLPDTLLAAPEMTSAGVGSWASFTADGDSLVVNASYPVIAFRSGIQQLPSIELGLAVRAAGSDAASIAEVVDRTGLSVVDVPLGSTTVRAYAAFAGDSIHVLRPPADVVGPEWSVWMILAIGLVVVAGVGGVGGLLPAWRTRGRAALAAPDPVFNRSRALAELDRLRSVGWQCEGGVEAFYQGLSDVVRRYAAASDLHLPRALTARELLARLEAHPHHRELVDSPLRLGELARFAREPISDARIESDWRSAREWVETTR